MVGALLALVAFAAFHNSFSVPLLFDDFLAITTNPSVWNLKNLGAVLAPPSDAPTAGRPLLNLTFALNYASHGVGVRGYHVVNFLLHVGAALALFGIVRRTILLSAKAKRFSASADVFALAAAGMWLAHPVQTASVTYISQRAEVLMGLFYLLTVYGFVRSLTESLPKVWPWISVATCALGMMSKESMVTAPVLILLLDRTFFAGTFRAALKQRSGYYAALAATWLILGGLMIGTRIGARGIGFEANVAAFTYALTQCRVVLKYAALAVWPFPLVFDHGYEVLVAGWRDVWLEVMTILAIMAGTLVLLRRTSVVGFLVAAFLLLLAPSSSLVPVLHQPMAENRLYLPLAALTVLAALALQAMFARRAWRVAGVLVVGLGFLTVRRNHDFRSAESIWADTVRKRPTNYRAHNYLGEALRTKGDSAGAVREARRALQLKPDNDVAHNNLGISLSANPETLPEAIEHFEAAARLRPDYAPVLTNLGVVLFNVPARQQEALAWLRKAVSLEPEYAMARECLGGVYLRLGNIPEAVQEYSEYVRLKPNEAKSHTNLAVAFAAAGRIADSMQQCRIALQLDPNYADAHVNLANALLQFQGGQVEAIGHCRKAIALRPDSVQAWVNLAVGLASVTGGDAEATVACRRALELQPGNASATRVLEELSRRASSAR